jgi:hypothetical protein
MSTGTTAADAHQTAENGQQMAQQLAEQTQQKAQQAAEQAKGTLRDQLDQRSSQVASQISGQASDLRAVSESLRQQGKEGPAGIAERLAGYAEQAGSYLRERNSETLLADAEDFGRRQPWAVGAGALALGFAASRFLKASSGQRYSARTGSQGNAGVPTPPTPYAPPTPSAPLAPGTLEPGTLQPPSVLPPLGSTGV